MAFSLDTLSGQPWRAFDTVIDVRSPSEFAEDHLPGAVSLPVLSDEERARVGTIYTQDSPFRARKIGAALVSRNAARHLEGPLADKEGGWRPLVYCWRGGQRSGSFATILGQVGWRVETLAGGYRAYRRHVVAALYHENLPHRIILLDGNTGTAKTRALQAAADAGAQTVDLEGLARHRGSTLGAQGPQPDQKAFESALLAALDPCDAARPVLVEAESSKIGSLNLPPALWAAMAGAPRIVLEAGAEARAGYLVRDYADLIADRAGLEVRLDTLRPLQGHARVDAWRALLRDGDVRALAHDLIVHHYDPAYARARSRQDAGPALAHIPMGSLDDGAIADAGARIAEILAAQRAAG